AEMEGGVPARTCFARGNFFVARERDRGMLAAGGEAHDRPILEHRENGRRRRFGTRGQGEGGRGCKEDTSVSHGDLGKGEGNGSRGQPSSYACAPTGPPPAR